MAAALSLQFALPSIDWRTGKPACILNPCYLHCHGQRPHPLSSGASFKASQMQIVIPKLDSTNNSYALGGIAENLNNEKPKDYVDDLYRLVLQSSKSIKKLIEAKAFHAHIIKNGFKDDIFVNNHFVSIYGKCGCLEDARQLFDKMPERNLVSWNTIIAGLAKNGHSEDALKLFGEMHLMGVKPDEFTFGSALKACANLAIPGQGKEIHAHVVKCGFELHIFVGSALVDMYVKCRNLDDAQKLFGELPERDLVSWTAMISAYSHDGQSIRALKIFCQMQRSGIRPNAFTFTGVLVACSSLAGLDQGRQFHALVIKHGLHTNTPVGNSLITMYSKSGSIEDAELVFRELSKLSMISWSAMISGYAYHGRAEQALQLFKEMQKAGMKPNHIHFVGVLSACSHGGLVKEGLRYFDSMSRDYGIVPSAEHYTCIVDLLGRSGLLEEAEDFIHRMPFTSCDSVWRTLLGACRVHNNIEIGLRAGERLLELAPFDASAYVLLSNIYAAANRWDDVARMRKKMDDMEVEKDAGLTWVEVKNTVHSFAARDKSHPRTEDIYATMKELTNQMKAAGYQPNTDLVLHDVEDEEKEKYLCHHSEKLAIAFGLISLPPGKPIRITKNLRVCLDCHTATKFISKITRREIVVRDGSRYHHFKDGICSCDDYW